MASATSFSVDLAGFGTGLIPILELSKGELVDGPPLLLVHTICQHHEEHLQGCVRHPLARSKT